MVPSGLRAPVDALCVRRCGQDWRCVDRRESLSTASYAVLVDSAGSVQFGVGDMDIHEAITPELVGVGDERGDSSGDAPGDSSGDGPGDR